MRNFLCFTLLLWSFFILTSCDNKNKPLGKGEGKKISYVHEDGYVGDAQCMSCHKDEYKAWKGSHHELAMQVANKKSVLGDFNNVKTTLDGVTYSFSKKGSEFWVHIKETDGSENDYKVTYTFGYTPLQQYLVDFSGGRKQVLRVSWNTLDKKWFHQYAGDKISSHDWLHWTRAAQNWNTMCAECHSTNLKKNYDVEKDVFHTTYSSINVSCESCHGPGEQHVDWAKENKGNSSETEKYILAGKTQEDLTNTCAKCHSRRSNIVKYADVGGKFDDQYIIQTITPEFYHADGQIDGEDYEFGSFFQSKMYHNGVKCTDCHDPHTMQRKKEGNALCLQCHKPSYNEPSHTFHQPNTEESLCVNCHMTGKNYMGNDFRRDHSFRRPRPDQSVVYGTPNACNNCHKDKSAKWAADQVEKWYGKDRDKHFSDYLLLSQKRNLTQPELTQVLQFINDNSYPAIARAAAINNTNVQSREDMNPILQSLNDPYPIVRFTALQKLVSLQSDEAASVAGQHLTDEIRLVRIGAIQALTYIKMDEVLANVNQSEFNNARSEYEEMLYANADFSNGRMNLGDFFEWSNQRDMAILQYKKTLQMDSLLYPAYSKLATAYSLKGDSKEAFNTLNLLIKKAPKNGYGYYLRGLLYFETKNDDAAISDLKTSAKYDPNNARAMYNLAVYYFQKQDFAQAENWIKQALKVTPNNPEYLNLENLIKQKR